MQIVEGGPAQRSRVVLPGGFTLIEAATATMAELGWRSGNLMLLGGTLARAALHMSVLTPGGPRWIDYGPARMMAEAWLANGSATFGDGALHCHAAVMAADGTLWGGHLDPAMTLLGTAGLVAWVTTTPGAGFALRPDGGGFTLLTPVAA